MYNLSKHTLHFRFSSYRLYHILRLFPYPPAKPVEFLQILSLQDKFKENRDRTEKICYNSAYGLQDHKKRDTGNPGIPLPCLSAAEGAALGTAVARTGYADALGAALALGIVAAFMGIALDGSSTGGASSRTVGRSRTLALLIGSTVGAGTYVDALQAAAAHLIVSAGSYLTFQICHLIPSFP